jgi:pimeloyl-ACP methyl ester carboxylesterase
MRRSRLEIDISDATPFRDRHAVRGWLAAPDGEPIPGEPVVVVCCLAGGTCSTGYWDLQVPGHERYSMAEHLSTSGVVTIAIDHLGVGASDRVDDVFLITPVVASAVHDMAFHSVLDGMRKGRWRDSQLVVVGVGHSMGGMLVGVQQARHETFDALAVLGHGGNGLPAVINDDEAAIQGPLDDVLPQIIDAARRRFPQSSSGEQRRLVPNSFPAEDVPPAVRRAFADQQTSLLYTCGLVSMIPHSTDLEKARITVPVFVAFGDRDLTDAYTSSMARYGSAQEASLFILRGSAHCHNQASTRTELWDRMTTWIDATVKR